MATSRRGGRITRLTARWPWLVAFRFGLLLGLGFAGALSEVGLPANAIPLALLFFNLGVEAGQLLFVAVVMALVAAVHGLTSKRWQSARAQLRYGQIEVACAYWIGAIATYWLADRTMAFWGVKSGPSMHQFKSLHRLYGAETEVARFPSALLRVLGQTKHQSLSGAEQRFDFRRNSRNSNRPCIGSCSVTRRTSAAW